jgi:hypothetical protein
MKKNLNRDSFLKEKSDIDSRLITNAVVSFQGHDGSFLSAEASGNLSISKEMKDDCKFYLYRVKKNIFVLETFHGTYIQELGGFTTGFGFKQKYDCNKSLKNR